MHKLAEHWRDTTSVCQCVTQLKYVCMTSMAHVFPQLVLQKMQFRNGAPEAPKTDLQQPHISTMKHTYLFLLSILLLGSYFRIFLTKWLETLPLVSILRLTRGQYGVPSVFKYWYFFSSLTQWQAAIICRQHLSLGSIKEICYKISCLFPNHVDKLSLFFLNIIFHMRP